MKLSRKVLRFILLLIYLKIHANVAQDYDEPKEEEPASPPPAVEECNGIYVSYEFLSRTKGYPHVKSTPAQSWTFNATATVVNTAAGPSILDLQSMEDIHRISAQRDSCFCKWSSFIGR